MEVLQEILKDDIQGFIKKKKEEGCLFILEKYLDKLPHDYWDTLMFMFSNGLDQRKDNSSVVILDDEESAELLEISSKEEIMVFVFSDEIRDKCKIIWNLMLTKEFIENDPEPKALYIGGENLRKFCDKRNIYYKSFLTKDNELLSGSNLMWQKKANEDCRVPVTKEKE